MKENKRGLQSKNYKPSQSQISYIEKVASQRVESDLRSFKFQKMLDDFLECEELNEKDEELSKRYYDYREEIFPKQGHPKDWNDYQKAVYFMSFEDFIAKMILVKEKVKNLFSKRERDTLKIIYFLIKKI